MTDRELLELAAKAAGMNIIDWGEDWNREGQEVAHVQHKGLHGLYTEWNPLTDDGDALRLAVKLNLTIQFPWDYSEKFLRETHVWTPADDPIKESHATDPYADTRRAIVRAAAEIGKQK